MAADMSAELFRDLPVFLTGLAFAAGAVWDLATVGRWWGASPEDPLPKAMVKSRGLWRTFQRSRLTGNIVILVFAVTATVSVLADDVRADPLPDSFRWVVMTIVTIPFVLEACVILLNRPRALVPPAFRSQAGLLGGGAADR